MLLINITSTSRVSVKSLTEREREAEAMKKLISSGQQIPEVERWKKLHLSMSKAIDQRERKVHIRYEG